MVTKTVSVIKLNSFVYDFFWDESEGNLLEEGNLGKTERKRKKSFGNFSSFFVFAPRMKQTIKKIAFSCFTHTTVRGGDGGKVLTTYFAWIVARAVRPR